MRILIALVVSACTATFFVSCKSDGAVASTFCDTACFRDTLKFSDDKHPLKPYVWFSANDCKADTITWSYTDMGKNRKSSISQLTGRAMSLSPSAIGCYIRDTSYAWVWFNDCSTGRGYLMKFPYSASAKGTTSTSAFNAFDKKFAVAPGLAVYSDRGNLFAEDMVTGKQASMTFGKRLEFDYDAIHELVDSVNVTPTRMWAKVKVDDEWKIFEKAIQLK